MVFGWIAETIQVERWEGTLEYTFMAPIRRYTQLLGSCVYAMGYGLVHTAVILVVMMIFFRQLDLSVQNVPTAMVFVVLGSFSFVGIGMMAAILPLLYVERGAQMTFVLQSCLLLVSGVYYPVEVLPPWMQVLSTLSPATYVLDGVRAGLLDGVPVSALMHDVVPLDRDGHRAHPGRHLGVRPRGALREAHRQAQAGRVMTSDAVQPAPAGLAELGWDPGWATAFLPYDAAGLRPARVVAAHRDAWVVARPSHADDADAIVSGRLPPRGARPGRPARGRRLGRRRAPRTTARPIVIQAVLPRRTAFTRSAGEERTGRQARRRAGARGERRRRVRRRGHGRRLQPAPARALPRGGVERRLDPGDRAQQGRRRRRRGRASGSRPRRSRPASRSGRCPR